MSARGEKRLWVIQRVTAAVLALCVVVHLATIIYAVRGGLSAAEILSRTRGSFAWGGFYGVFVIAAAAHGSIGLRTVAMEWLGLDARGAHRLMAVVAMALVFFGLRAVYAVVAA
jgi:fumarate reductase subunit C